MKRIVLLGTAIMLAPLAASPVFADPAPPAAVPPAPPAPRATYNSTDTDIGTLLDNPATKAVLAKDLPRLLANPMIDQARPLTLKQLQAYAGGKLTDEKLAQVDADLAQVAVAK